MLSQYSPNDNGDFMLELSEGYPLYTDPGEVKELAGLISKNFIQRKDVKAIQNEDGSYKPDRTPWKLKDLKDHVSGESVFGHYVCDQESLTKIFAFDIDLETTGTWIERPDLDTVPDGPMADERLATHSILHESTPRESWKDFRRDWQSNFYRPTTEGHYKNRFRNPIYLEGRWYTYQLRTLVELLTSAVHSQFGIRTVATYSGNKGAHVYGLFEEPVTAELARSAALLCLEYAGNILTKEFTFEPTRGSNFFKYTDPDPITGFQNFAIELFPKQDTMEGKDLGNLLRLPMGRNNKNIYDMAFFIDQTQPFDVIEPHLDPIQLLKSSNPWQYYKRDWTNYVEPERD